MRPDGSLRVDAGGCGFWRHFICKIQSSVDRRVAGQAGRATLARWQLRGCLVRARWLSRVVGVLAGWPLVAGSSIGRVRLDKCRFGYCRLGIVIFILSLSITLDLSFRKKGNGPTMNYAFISHSTEDKNLAESLAQRLGKENVFFDKWNLSSGRLLASDIAKGVFGSSWFIIIASKSAAKSQWIKYEMNLAVIRWIEDENYRILVARIDDCDIPHELKPFLYIDCPGKPIEAIEKITEAILSEGKGIVSRKEDWQRSFSLIDRHRELEAIEVAALENMKSIFIWGTYGIGKSALVEHAAFQLFKRRISRFPLTSGHEIQRLALEMAGRAKMDLPAPTASDNELMTIALDAMKELAAKGNIIFFDDVELALNDDSSLKAFLSELLDNIMRFDEMPPIFLSSTRDPRLGNHLREKSHVIKLGPLSDGYTMACLKRWLMISDPGKAIPENEKLEMVSNQLHGYPLAARLASYVIAKFSLDETLKDLHYFQDIRIDMATQLIGRSRAKLTPIQIKILGALTIVDTGLTQYDLSQIIAIDIDDLRIEVDDLFSYMFISIEEGRLQILSLMKDYFWRYAYSSGTWKETSKIIAMHARNHLSSCDPNGEDFVHYCSIAYRLFLLSNKYQEAQSLKYYFKGELRDSCMKLYKARDYKTSYKYANIWLSMSPNDNEVRLFKARSLRQMDRFAEAKLEIAELEKMNYAPEKVNHLKGLICKDNGNYDDAIIYFKKGLDFRQNYLPILRDYGDALERKGDLNLALEILDQAYNISPRDQFVVPKYIEVMQKLGHYESALSIIEGLLITYPDSASFHHTASMLHMNLGQFEKSYSHAKQAVELDERQFEAILHLAALEVHKNNIPESERLLSLLPEDVIKYKIKLIRDTIHAEILLKENRLNEARGLLRNRCFEDSYCADISARIELSDASALIANHDYKIAQNRILKGLEIVDEALELYPNNFSLKKTAELLDKLNCQIQ